MIEAIDVVAGYQDQKEKLRMIVSASDGPSLLGRDIIISQVPGINSTKSKIHLICMKREKVRDQHSFQG